MRYNYKTLSCWKFMLVYVRIVYVIKMDIGPGSPMYPNCQVRPLSL